MKYSRPAYISILAMFLISVLLMVGCATHKTINLNSNSGLLWPGPPEKSRIAYVASFSNPESFGINKGFFTWLSELFLGEEERNMIRPMAITQTSDEVLFVADPGVKGVHRYDLINKRYSLIRQVGEKLLPSPVGLAVDKNDNVYVVDSELAQLFKIKKNQEVAEAVSLHYLLVQPTSIAVDSDTSSFYISDTAEHQIKHFNFAGKLRSIIGKRGKAESEFNYPTMIWRDKTGNLFVNDSLNFRIQKFNSDGEFISQLGKQGGASGNLSRSKGIATDSNGHIYVVDALFHVFQLFDEKGRFLLHVGAQGQKQGQFWLPSGIFISNNDVIYIADSHNKRVQVFRYIGGQL